MLDMLAFMTEESIEAICSPRHGVYRDIGWSSERNYYRLLRKLESDGLISSKSGNSPNSLQIAITSLGKAALLDRIDPPAAWSASWDGKWRTLSFDLPQNAHKERAEFRVWLLRNRFGKLQGSLWITHRDQQDWLGDLASVSLDPKDLFIQESIPIGENTHHDYIMAAWSFLKVNKAYKAYLSFVQEGIPAIGNESDFSSWHNKESTLWRTAFEKDPFLPNQLLPQGYLGKEAWEARKAAYNRIAR